MRHKFEIGQAVVPASPRKDRHHVYYIVQLIPETSYEPQYRIQEAKSGITCVVAETDIKVAEVHRA
jgi:carbohydrate-binding DOMON domain-containing protein